MARIDYRAHTITSQREKHVTLCTKEAGGTLHDFLPDVAPQMLSHRGCDITCHASGVSRSNSTNNSSDFPQGPRCHRPPGNKMITVHKDSRQHKPRIVRLRSSCTIASAISTTKRRLSASVVSFMEGSLILPRRRLCPSLYNSPPAAWFDNGLLYVLSIHSPTMRLKTCCPLMHAVDNAVQFGALFLVQHLPLMPPHGAWHSIRLSMMLRAATSCRSDVRESGMEAKKTQERTRLACRSQGLVPKHGGRVCRMKFDIGNASLLLESPL